jgi:secreted trypsin-like serine protease
LAAVGIGFWLTMAGGVSAGPGGDERIVGGNVADPADWPYIAAITTPSGDQFCGGAVISPDAVLTAAHCMVDDFGSPSDPDTVRVVTGRPDLPDEGAGQELEADDIFVHRQYLRRFHHDVAVIRLSDPTTATPAVLPTPLEDQQATEVGDELRVAGWGSTKRAGGAESDVLRDVSTFAAKDRKCESAFSFYRPGEEICTLGERTGLNRTSSCYGDSGGPLVADTLAGARLVGVVSYGGRRCGVSDPTVYGRVADNLGFITEKADLP